MSAEEIKKIDCKVCDSFKDKDKIVYEDELAVALLGDSVVGHIKVYPKRHVVKIEELTDEEVDRVFMVASYAATVVFETLGMQGTNILSKNLPSEPHFCVDIIPRNVSDDFDFQWQPQTVDENEMKSILDRIKDKCDYIGVEKPKDKPVEVKKTGEVIEDKESYMVKHLERVP